MKVSIYQIIAEIAKTERINMINKSLLNKAKKFVHNLILFLVVLFIITYFWSALELLLYGQTYPSAEDTIMGLILAASLQYNLKKK